MSEPPKESMAPFLVPLEIKLADVMFISMRKNLILFKDLSNRHIHYSVFIRGSLIDVHQTLERRHKHNPILEIEFDWQSLVDRIVQEITTNWRFIIQTAKTHDPKWADLEIESIPAQALSELLPSLIKGVRWNLDMKFLEKLEASICRSTLGELADNELRIGTGSGYLVMSNGIECVLFDTERMSKIIEKSFRLSLTRVRLRSFTARSIWGYFKMRLLVLNNSTVRHLRKL